MSLVELKFTATVRNKRICYVMLGYVMLCLLLLVSFSGR